MATKINFTFLLRGIEPAKILTDYQNGYFSRPREVKSKFRIAQNTTILAPTYGNSNQAGIYAIKDRNNSNVVIATTNQANFEVFTKTGGELPKGGRCPVCLQDFDHEAIGYPLAYQETTILTNADPDPKKGVYRIIYTFWVDDARFCCFEHAYWYVRNILIRPADQRDTTIRNSEQLLQLLFMFMHPGKKLLLPANDPKLLISNKGSLTNEEWQNNRHLYVATDRVVVIPLKREYIQQHFNASTPFEILS